MKLSRKLKRKLKKRLLTRLSSITIVLMLLAGGKMAGISAPFEKLASLENLSGIAGETSKIAEDENVEISKADIAINVGTRLPNTDTVTYIYDASDLKTFRDSVNAGDNYSGKTVYLMDDIDLSTECSSTLGSWTPIGATGTYFAGTFDGNYHTISNLYYNSNKYLIVGLFTKTISSTVIQNLVLENVQITNTIETSTNTDRRYVGGITGYFDAGIIQNCGIKSGSLVCGTTTTNKNYGSAGGISGGKNSSGKTSNCKIINCYNNASVSAKGSTSTSDKGLIYVGGILGYGAYLYGLEISNCYNTGTIYAYGRQANVGGVIGYVARASSYSAKSITLKNLYNVGKVTADGTNKNPGGVIGANGYSGTSYAITLSNSYCLTSTTYLYSGVSTSTSNRVTATTLKTYTVKLGSAYAYDVYNKNGEYPVLAWQNEITVMNLNRNQEYIKVGETLKLNVVETDEVTEKIGTNYANSNFTWKSTNEDVATVNENGQVTGISDGYTTVYAYHEASGMYAMAVINVAKDFTNPQIETGNGFTAILKSDGTVWTIGNNTSGQLGNGTTDNSNIPVQVKIDEDTNLSNIIKIAVGTDHVLALSKDGKVYSWGLNTNGQLGQNNTTSSSYAKLVLGEDGASYLSNVVDISAGAYGSIALDKNGKVYVWGNGTYGEMGNSTTTSSNLPIKTTIENAIQVSMGAGDIGALTSDGVVWSWGRNTHGQHGINCTSNTAYPMKTAINVTELSKGGYHTTVKKIDGTVYGVGCNSYGRMATTNTGNTTTYAQTTLPSTVTETNKVKYIKAGIINTTIQLTDGTVWETGFNLQGELGNGNNTTQTSFTQGLTENGVMENVLIIGRNTGNISGTTTTGYGLNTAVITENGDIYTTGDNSYGQIGNNTTTNTSYYTKMGYAYLDYEDKTIEIDENGYQIDLDKLKYVYSSINAYNNEQTYTLGDIKYTSLNETIAKVDENGKITAKDGVSGIAQIKIEDISNGYETYITAIVNKLENTDTVTYIYSAEDMVKFRDSVNAGNNYAGKTVYVMADIDLSTVCSSTIGNWTPIGATGTYFAGTFDGNYHTIKNLYYNSNKYLIVGLFTKTTSSTVIQNLVLENVQITNTIETSTATDRRFVGGITGYFDAGIIQNCGIKSGSLVCGTTTTNKNYGSAGGIAGGKIASAKTSSCKITNCYNNASVTAKGSTSTSDKGLIYVGGILGYGAYLYGIEVSNCYNTGTIYAYGRQANVGGVIGYIGRESGYATTCATLKNLYNTGTVTAGGTTKNPGGIIGANGYLSTSYSITLSNSYCLTNTTYLYQGNTTSTSNRVASDTLKTYASKLGKAFEDDDLSINNGYPILWWQSQTIELNKKQEYIKVGETLQLSVIQNEAVATVFNKEINTSDFAWTSTNEDIATVNESGLVTGVSDGYTTIYGYNEEKDIYTMCVINVAKDVANPQVETGEGFTAILKADGTVWTIGKNENGELGDGTNDERIEAVQVKTGENTYLTNVVKISVGTNHVLALTKDGKVYAWGANTYGQLGQNNKENANYAKLVLGEGGSSYLERIVDITAGSYGSVAVNQFGWVLVWGNGTYGEMGNTTTLSNLTPTKSTLNTAISASMGAGHVIAIGQNGNGYAWGRNSYGELAQGNTTDSTSIIKVENGVTEVSASGFETVIKKVNGSILGAGLNTNGQLANGTVTNKTTFTAMAIPTEVTESNKVKYVKAGRTSTSLMLTDGAVYVAGNYTKGILESTSSFEQAKTKAGKIESGLILGRSSGETLSLNTAVIDKTGRVYTVGSNEYGQIGNNTKEDAKYFTEMGYVEVIYPEKITMKVGDTKTLTDEDFAYIEKYFNVYKEDITKVSLVADGKIIDADIANYENGTITAKNIGKTMLVVKKESTQTLVYIPVMVLPENGTVVPDVKTGDNFTVTLKSNGSVWSFGTNTNGELGHGDNTNKNYPKQVEILKDKIIEQISVGNNHVIALTQDGKVYTWGLNSKGQLGVGTIKNSNIPQLVEMPESTELVQVIKDTIVKVIANKNTSYAITQSGKIYAWGEGYGKTPVQLELDYDIVDISNSYMLDMQGNVYDKDTNTRLEIVEKIKYISEGNSHTVFLSENGTGYAIGSNTYGQFGDGTNVSNEEQVVAIRNKDLTDVLRNIEKLEAGDGYTVATLKDGTLVEFGSNQYGQLGTDEIQETNTIRENTAVTKLLSEENEKIILTDAGKSHVAITLSDGNVYTWGLGAEGQLGNGANENEVEAQLVGKNIIETNTNNLVLSQNETFELNSNTTYFNLLQDINGEISYESKDESVVKVDAQTGEVKAINQGTTVIVVREVGTNNISVVQVRVLPEGIAIEPQVQTNGSHTVTLKVDGTVWCYGNNENGELGNGTNLYSDEPVQAIFPEGVTIMQVEAGENFSVALDTDGNVWTWGANDYYQLGNNSSTYVTKPTKVASLSNITKIATGTYSVLAINENKEVYGWGLNANGELGIGSYTNKVATPTKAKNMLDIIDIAVGKNHSIALKSTGEVFVTGLNLYGQLGNNDTTTKKVNTFTKVQNLSAVARISATDSGNIVSDVNGKVYSWGLNIYGELGQGDKTNRYEPTLVNEIENIVLVSGGKNHSVLLDKTGKVYTTGSNKYGYLGNGTNVESTKYIQVPNLDNVMTISAGNTYTAIAKTDGTVWGFGDYNHGDKQLKSKTASSVPMQVGNDAFGLGVIEVTIKKSETVNITSDMVYSFNLIYLDKNNTQKLTYQSLNEEIAIVNEYGEVLGVREGFTWVKVTEEDGTEHVVYVYVTDSEYAPKVTGGENFASVLKADGSVWTFGHNNNGELGIGSNRTKDIPEKTNVISSYKQISSGESFTIALRQDGTVWSYGKNNYGQLGIENTTNGLNPVQVNGITDIVQVATGKEHAIALDEYGILYGWGNNANGQLGISSSNVLVPTPISYTGGTIQSIWAGENQSIIINTKGEIYGYGSLLNGKLEGIDNAVKVSVGNGYMLILLADGNVYKYDGNNLTQYTELAQIVDIDVTNNNNIAQTVNEKVYTWIDGSEPELEEIESIYTIGAGTNNSYIIKTDGNVYAKGKNQYGQLGNSTRIDSLDKFTLVGNRKFTVEPKNAIMYVNDVEELTEKLQINEFNVFNRSIRNGEEYTWLSSNSDVVKVENGTLTAIADGTAQITITDTVTNAEETVTRVVIPVEKDRIEELKVNDYKAEITDEYKYYVEVETNNNTGTLNITTKNNTDKISIDNGVTWFENGTLTTQIEMVDEKTEVEIIVETANGTQIPYTLVVKKISTDVSLENITVDGISATAISATKYEVVVPEETDLSEIIARANNNKAEVSINGEQFITWKSIITLQYENNLTITLPVVVKAENGDELEYLLTIYKESEALKLESLTVDGVEAIKTSEGIYSITIARNLNEVEVTAKAISELVNVSVNNEEAEVQISTKKVEISEEITEVQIRLSTTIDGEEVYRDYTLNIYKKAESGKIQFVIVNGTVITPNVNGEYEAYLPAETENATVKVIAENALDYVQIDENEKQIETSEVQVSTSQDLNEYEIIISDEEGNSEKYKLYIKKPSVDASIKEITVSNGDDVVIAKKSTKEENVYIAKVKTYDEYEVKATTNNINAYVSIEEETKVKNVATKVVTKTADYMEVKIEVESENGDLEEYILKIYVKSSDTALEYIKVNDTQATLQSDGSYLISLETAETKVSVTVQTVSKVAEVRLENEDYDTNITTKDVTIDAKDTIKYIYVKAEDGTTKKYKLVISGLPDDSTLQKVTVNGIEAKYIEGQNKYEIRLDSAEFNIQAIATDSLAKVSLNDGEQSVGTATTTITKQGNVTTVKIKVVSQGGVESSEYTLEIKEKSNDSSIGTVMVDGKIATKEADGNYTASVKNNVESAIIKVEANDSYAIVYLDEETQNSNNITVTKHIEGRKNVYVIKVIAEDGTEESHTLTVTKLENNTNIKELTVSYELVNVDEDTNEITSEQKTYTPSLQEDGTYYLKIDRVESVDIKAILEDENARVKIKNSEYVIAENEATVSTVGEKTEIIILVKSEDGTEKEHKLILERKSNDTTIKTIASEDIIKLDDLKIYVDESLNETDLTITANSELATIKLDSDTDYTPIQITRTIDLSEETKVEDESISGWLVSVEVKAEDGTIGNYTITIVKTGNTNIDTVKVNNETVENINDTYTKRVNVAENAEVEIVTENENAKIQIIEISEDEENSTETVIATGTGTLLADVALNENPQNYIIRITSANGSTIYDYDLVIEQKSTDVSLSYVKVDNIASIKTDDGYKSVVSGKDKYPVTIKANDEKAQIKIAYKDYVGSYSKGKLQEEVPVEEGETLEVTITVTSENGDEENYKLFITRISSNTELEYVRINGETVTNFNKDTNTYKIIVDNTLTSSQLEVKSISDKAKITIVSKEDTGLITTNVTLDGPATTKKITIKVEAEDGTTKYYYLEIEQLSASVSIDKITVNDIEATKVNETNYEVTISNKTGLANVIAKAQDELSKVAIAKDEETTSQATKTFTLNGLETIQTTIKVTAEDGSFKEYNLKITVLESSNSVSYVKVNTGVIEPEEDGTTYKTFINYNSINANIEIKAESQYAEVKITNAEDLSISNQSNSKGVLSFTVDTPQEVTTINYTVTSQAGETKEYSIILTKISTDNTLKELYVDSQLIQVDEDGNYYADIENAKEVVVKAIATNRYANIRIDYNEEELQQTQKTVNAQELNNKVTITITSQTGVTAKYYLYVRVLANNTELDKLIVDSAEVTNYNETTKTYTALVDNTKNSYEVFLMAVNDNATVELYDGETLISTGVGSITDILTLGTSEESHEYKIKVSLDEENYSNYTLKVARTSNDTSLKYVEVNEVVREALETDAYVYEVGIPKLAEKAKIKVVTANSLATVKIGENATVTSGDEVEITLKLNESRITVPVVVTAPNGTTIDTYNILLIRQSNEAQIESVVVNGKEVENKEDVYTYYMGVDEYIAKTEITMPEDNNAKIQVDTNEGLGYLEFTENFEVNTIKVEKTIKVTSEDGSVVKEYKLVLVKTTVIKGLITTENYEGKHISTISLYKEGKEEPITEIETKEDGSYELNIEEVGKYEVVVRKEGYLSYTVGNIEIEAGSKEEIGSYKLKAGDVNGTEEVEVYDLVGMNENIGVTIGEENKAEKGKYDLNEDGIVDETDREILKANYGKLAERVEWEKTAGINVMSMEESNVVSLGIEIPTEDEEKEENSEESEILIKPILTEYKITSEYGYRTHPTTGEYKKHTGIDISGEWHTEIISVAEGEVVSAGVDTAFGNCVEIKHEINGETIYSFYAHMSEIKVEVGQKVSQGEEIGKEGGAESDPNHGYSTGHHLHFEIRKASGYGNDVDPNENIGF